MCASIVHQCPGSNITLVVESKLVTAVPESGYFGGRAIKSRTLSHRRSGELEDPDTGITYHSGIFIKKDNSIKYSNFTSNVKLKDSRALYIIRSEI